MALLTIATFNVNSVRMRAERLAAWLALRQPDIVCLQELKCLDDQFPRGVFRAKGYGAAVFGQKAYNGVAILSRGDIDTIQRGFDDNVEDPQSRFLSVQTMGVQVACAYMPNGERVGSDKWDYKLTWLARLERWLDKNLQNDKPFALCGDYNIAPDDSDVRTPEAWRDSTLCDERVREAYRRLQSKGLMDTVRAMYPDGGPLTWWDYRSGGLQRDDGLRIDHVLATAPLASTLVSATVDRDEREGESASDHAPVRVTFER
ncbi:MAG: exodeoxyribonuclease III [Deltaproteobacteria bacterium]|nr:exodeoxyribonuclease III [Deltaproteobacteria bacterium]